MSTHTGTGTTPSSLTGSISTTAAGAVSPASVPGSVSGPTVSVVGSALSSTSIAQGLIDEALAALATPPIKVGGEEEREALRSFFARPEQRLLARRIDTRANDPEEEDDVDSPTAEAAAQSTYGVSESDLDVLLTEKNGLGSASALAATVSGAAVGPPVPPIKDATLSGVTLFIAALAHIERETLQIRTATGTPAVSGACFARLDDLVSAVRAHYRLLAVQMVEALKYLKTSRRLLRDARLTITWTLQREVLHLYTIGGADLNTLPIVRRLECDRYQHAPFEDLVHLVAAVREAHATLALAPPTPEADRARVLAALATGTNSASGSGPAVLRRARSGAGSAGTQSLLPRALLDGATSPETRAHVDALLVEFPLFTLLQHVAVLRHDLAMRAAEAREAAREAVKPNATSTVPTPGPVSRVVSLDSSTRAAAYGSWSSLAVALHESVLDHNRLRSEVLDLLQAPTCPLLALAPAPVALAFDAVDRLVRACGLVHADLLETLQHLSDRGTRTASLPELASRVKAFYLARRKAESQQARYALMKDAVLAYFASDACQLFLHAAARARVLADIERDAALFVQLMQAGGGTLKTLLTAVQSLESEEVAFDSLDALIEGVRVWAAKEVLKKRFLPFINNANLCRLFDRNAGAGRFKEVRPDDPALAALLAIDISDSALAEMRKQRTEGGGADGSSDSLPSEPPTALRALSVVSGAAHASASEDADSPAARAELVLEFVYRMNAALDSPGSSGRRFATFAELVQVVRRELERPRNAANPLAPPTPALKHHRPRRSLEDFSLSGYGVDTESLNTGGPPDHDQYQIGFESDEDIDARDLQRPQVPPSPSATTGPAGISRKGSLAAAVRRPSQRFGLPASAFGSSGSGGSGGDDIEETPEEAAAEVARRKARTLEKLRREVEQLQHHGWVLKEDEEWSAIDRAEYEEPPMTEELLDERRLAIFSALSYPACLLFSERIEPMSLSDIDLDAVLASAGGGEKGLKIAIAIVSLLDRKRVKYIWFDEVTLEIARRWQRRKAWEYLTLDAGGKQLLENNHSVPLFVLRVLVAINRAHGVDPALTAVDVLRLVHEGHPAPFHSHAELLHTVRSVSRVERRETLRAALRAQFSNLFPRMPSLTDVKMDLLLGGVDESLYHALKYLELIQSEGGRNFADVLDLVPLLTSLHSREKSGAPDFFADELEDEDEADAASASQPDGLEEEDPPVTGADEVMLKRQKVFMALSFPRCQLFAGQTDSFTLTDVDLDDVVKAANNRLAFALRTISAMDRGEGVKFGSFFSAVVEIAKRCQTQHTVAFLRSRECHLLHPSVRLPRARDEEGWTSLATSLLKDGMTRADPYLTVLACLKALNQVPKVLAQSPPAGGYRSIDELVAALKSLADEQRVWMVKSYFSHTSLRIHPPGLAAAVAAGERKPRLPPISDAQVQEMLATCGQSIYFVLRHLQALELVATVSSTGISPALSGSKRPIYEGYEGVRLAVAAAHDRTLATDDTLREFYSPVAASTEAVAKPNEAKQVALAEQLAAAAAAGTRLNRASRDQILVSADPNADKIRAAALALIEYERIEGDLLARTSQAPRAVVSSAQRAAAEARFQVLTSMAHPKSRIFENALRRVDVTDAELDVFIRDNFAGVDAELASEARLDAAESGGEAWAPSPEQIAAAIACVRDFDAARLRFRSFAHFQREARVRARRAKHEVLLSKLAFPRSRLFVACTQSVTVSEEDLDRLACIPRPNYNDVADDEKGARPPTRFLPLKRVLDTLTHLDAGGIQVYSFVELADLVRAILTEG